MSLSTGSLAETFAGAILQEHKKKFLEEVAKAFVGNPNGAKLAEIFTGYYDAATASVGTIATSIAVPVTGGQAASPSNGFSQQAAAPGQYAPMQYAPHQQQMMAQQAFSQPAAAFNPNALPPHSVRNLAELGQVGVNVRIPTTVQAPPGALCGVGFTKKGFQGVFYCNKPVTDLGECGVWTGKAHKGRKSVDARGTGKTSNPKSGTIAYSRLIGTNQPALTAIGGNPQSIAGLANLMQQSTGITPAFNQAQMQGSLNVPSAMDTQMSQQIMNSVQSGVQNVPVQQGSNPATLDFNALLASQNNITQVAVNQPNPITNIVGAQNAALAGVPSTPAPNQVPLNQTNITAMLQQAENTPIQVNTALPAQQFNGDDEIEDSEEEDFEMDEEEEIGVNQVDLQNALASAQTSVAPATDINQLLSNQGGLIAATHVAQ